MDTPPEPLQLFELGESLGDGRTPEAVGRHVVLAKLVRDISRTDDLLGRGRMLVELAVAVQLDIELVIADARVTGISWRELAARLGVPHQTLHRRHRPPSTDAGGPGGEA